jgi:ATP-binding cassette subfamily G (WHITE) protein 1
MYGVLPYYLTKTLVEMPYQLSMPVLFTLIVYWGIGFRNEAASFFIFLSALMLMVFFGNSIGILMSSMFSNVRSAFAVVPVFS